MKREVRTFMQKFVKYCPTPKVLLLVILGILIGVILYLIFLLK
ncbi:MAG TPA: hypothetical protein PLD77_02170 [Candidatus Dojkabacteria bacterium]|nr:hypothetical protein [Candidatus Dojkabacteria bacterium]